MRNCDVVISGEGSYDAQSAGGKVVSHVKSVAARVGKPVVVLCGRMDGAVVAEHERVFDLLSFTGNEL